MNNVQKTVDSINNGNIEDILSGVTSKTPIIVLNAIISGTNIRLKDKEFIDGVLNAEKNDLTILGVPINVFAKASLDVLGIKRYTGDDVRVKEVIESNFKF